MTEVSARQGRLALPRKGCRNGENGQIRLNGWGCGAWVKKDDARSMNDATPSIIAGSPRTTDDAQSMNDDTRSIISGSPSMTDDVRRTTDGARSMTADAESIMVGARSMGAGSRRMTGRVPGMAAGARRMRVVADDGDVVLLLVSSVGRGVPPSRWPLPIERTPRRDASPYLGADPPSFNGPITVPGDFRLSEMGDVF
jgi:hypothetical protein